MKAETELIVLAKAGCQDSYEELISSHQDTIYNLVYRMAPHSAQDLTQEVFFKAYRGLKGFKGQSSFKTWLVRLALNHVQNHLRKERLQGLLFPSAQDLPLESPQAWDLSLEIKEALLALPKKERAIIVLHDVLGFRYREVGEILKIPMGTVKSRLFYARQHLREILKEG